MIQERFYNKEEINKFFIDYLKSNPLHRETYYNEADDDYYVTEGSILSMLNPSERMLLSITVKVHTIETYIRKL